MSKEESYNIGWAFLRIWMGFEIVLTHYWINKTNAFWIFDKTTTFAVPVFMLLSFI